MFTLEVLRLGSKPVRDSNRLSQDAGEFPAFNQFFDQFPALLLFYEAFNTNCCAFLFTTMVYSFKYPGPVFRSKSEMLGIVVLF